MRGIIGVGRVASRRAPSDASALWGPCWNVPVDRRAEQFSMVETFIGKSKKGIDSDLMKPAAAACRALSMMRSSCSGKIRGRSR